MSFFTGKNLLLVGFLAVLLAVIPAIVYFMTTQSTNTQSKATPATRLYFALPGQTTEVTTPVQKNVNDPVKLDIVMDPGTNQVIATTLFITFDPTKLQLDGDKLKPTLIESASQTEGFNSILAGPTFTESSATITLTVGVDVTKVIKSTQKIATITFKALAPSADTKVSFDNSKTNVTSSVDPEMNVLSSASPATIVIGQGSGGGTPTNTPVPGVPTATPAPTGTSTPNQIPVCTALNIDRVATGSAPFSITFTANGNDPDNTINKVTFDFGDGPVQDVTTGGGIGTKTVSVQTAHTYNNVGTYKASVILTDSSSGLSKATDCMKTITVTAEAAQAPPAAVVVAPTNPPPPAPKNLNSGPGETILGIGAFGLGLTVLGGIIFFAL